MELNDPRLSLTLLAQPPAAPPPTREGEGGHARLARTAATCYSLLLSANIQHSPPAPSPGREGGREGGRPSQHD